MASRAVLDDILKKEVPDWGDDDFARARFKAFTGQKQDWEGRLFFWKELVVKVAQHLDLLVIDTQTVEQKWFIRDGVVPMGLQHVLAEMKKSGELDTVEQVLGARPSNFQLVGNFLRNAIVWAGLNVLSDSYADTKPLIEQRLVVVPVLQERVFRLLKTLADTHFSSICIASKSKIMDLCGGPEDAELVMGYLLLQKEAQFMTITGADHMEGFKISLNGIRVSPASETDHHVLQLHCTLEMLQIRLNTLDERIAKARNTTIKSAKAGDKGIALRNLRSMKVLQANREQCASSMDKIDHVLTIIMDSETSKKVSEAMQVAANAIKDSHVSLDEVHQTLNELDEAIARQREIDEALVGAPIPTSEVFDDAAIDEELGQLEEELEAEDLYLPDVPKLTVAGHEFKSQSSSQGLESDSQKGQAKLEEEFSNLTLELG